MPADEDVQYALLLAICAATSSSSIYHLPLERRHLDRPFAALKEQTKKVDMGLLKAVPEWHLQKCKALPPAFPDKMTESHLCLRGRDVTNTTTTAERLLHALCQGSD